MEIGHEIGLIDDLMYRRFQEKKVAIQSESARFQQLTFTPTEALNRQFAECGLAPMKAKTTLAELFKRPDFTIDVAKKLFPEELHMQSSSRSRSRSNRRLYRQSMKDESSKKRNDGLIPEDVDWDISYSNLA